MTEVFVLCAENEDPHSLVDCLLLHRSEITVCSDPDEPLWATEQERQKEIQKGA